MERGGRDPATAASTAAAAALGADGPAAERGTNGCGAGVAQFGLFGTLAERPDNEPARELVSAFHALPAGQLVVLGPAGAGKSVLALLFTLDMIAADEQVPVLLPAAA